MIKFFSLFFCLYISLLNAQKIQDKDLTNTQIDFLLGLDDLFGFNYTDEGVNGFYNYTNDVPLLTTLPDLEILRFSRFITTAFSVLKEAY